MGNASILHKRLPVRKRFSRRFFPTKFFKASKLGHHPPQVAGFAHAGTLARQILAELWAHAQHTSAQQEQTSVKGTER